MGLWIRQQLGDRVKLDYTHQPLDPNPLWQPCGETGVDALVDVEAWVISEAAPWDLIRAPAGTFGRQRAVEDDRRAADAGPLPALRTAEA